MEKTLNDINSDLDKLINLDYDQQNLKKTKDYLRHHIETIDYYALMNIKILKQIGSGGHSYVIYKTYIYKRLNLIIKICLNRYF